MADYTCKCEGEFRYTTSDAVRMQFHCKRCKTNLIELKDAQPHSLDDIRDESGDNERLSNFSKDAQDSTQRILAAEQDRIKLRKVGKQTPKDEPRQMVEDTTQDDVSQVERTRAKLPEVGPPKERHDLPELTERVSLEINGVSDDRIREQIAQAFARAPFRVPEVDKQDPDIRIQYAHGVVYEFMWSEIEDIETFRDDLVDFTVAWTTRRDYRLSFVARGRLWLLNSGTCAGVDYK